jgi:hypothetical protein
MAQKNATPSREQQNYLKAAGLNHLMWVVVRELPSSLIVKHRITGEFKHIDKKEART